MCIIHQTYDATQQLQHIKMKRRMTISSKRSKVFAGGTLPEELIYDILSILPVKALMRFKSACKTWQAIVSDRRFISSHLQREKDHFRVLLIPIYGSGTFSYLMELEEKPAICVPKILDIPGLEAMAYSHAIPSHCDGLLLFDCEQKMHVCNPATRELVTLLRGYPSKKPFCHNALSRQTAVLGHDPCDNKYKVVRYFYRCFDYGTRSCSLGLEVFTLGGGCCWVPEQDPPYPILPNWVLHVHGVIYWYIDNLLHSSSPQAILSFNLRDHKFTLVPPPPTCSNVAGFRKSSFLKELDGNLCCIHVCGSLCHVYVYRAATADCKDRHEAWHLSYTMSLSIFEHPACGDIVFCQDGKILVCFDNCCFQCYDPRTHTMELVAGSMNRLPILSEKLKNAAKNCARGAPWIHFTRYMESMVRINY